MERKIFAQETGPFVRAKILKKMSFNGKKRKYAVIKLAAFYFEV